MAWNDAPQPTLRTMRLTLRPLRESDAARLEPLVSEHAIADTTAVIPHPYPEGGSLVWIETQPAAWVNGTQATFGIALAATDEPVGALSLRIEALGNSAELGYWIGTPYWNRGYMTEAVEAAIDFGFDVVGLNRIYALHMARNPASGRVMEKAGMTFEGIVRQGIRRWGVYEDLALRSILRSEWDAGRAR